MTDIERSYDEIAAELETLAGQRVRLTYRNTAQQVGVVSVRDFGHCKDVLIDGHGGSNYEDVVQVETMQANGRYA